LTRFWGLLATAVLAAAIVLALAPASALATHVSCGDTITTDTTLDSDLIDCPGNGIVIGSDNITLDLTIPGSSVVLTRNMANDNGDFGIEAVPGVTDGAGNKASGNSNPLQCLNVFCR
jgi:hypothetical protein